MEWTIESGVSGKYEYPVESPDGRAAGIVEGDLDCMLVDSTGVGQCDSAGMSVRRTEGESPVANGGFARYFEKSPDFQASREITADFPPAGDTVYFGLHLS